MKPINSKMKSFFTIQDNLNRRKATKRMEEILATNHEKANLNT